MSRKKKKGSGKETEPNSSDAEPNSPSRHDNAQTEDAKTTDANKPGPINSKNIVTLLLLAFVGVSVVVLLAKETGGEQAALTDEANARSSADAGRQAEPSSERARQEAISSAAASLSEGPGAKEPAATEMGDKIIVSYMHGRARCGPCRILQAYAAEAVSEHFADELSSGEMEFRVVNVATPEHRHLAQHYELYTQSVIVSKMRNGKEERWQNLDQIWQLVRDRDAYFEYIRNEIEEFRSEQ